MIEIVSGDKALRVSPFERENTPDAPAYDWIKTFVEYELPGLRVQYQASFNVGELISLKENLAVLHSGLVNDDKPHDLVFDSTENQLNLIFSPSTSGRGVLVTLTLRPESPSESVVVNDSLGIDESYFPALLSAVGEMINWQS